MGHARAGIVCNDPQMVSWGALPRTTGEIPGSENR